MTHPLDGSDFKIVWAQKRLDRITALAVDYVSANPSTFPIEHHGKEMHVKMPTITTQPDGRKIGGLAGDFLVASMAALDYVIWELATWHCARRTPPYSLTPPPMGRDKPSFPLFMPNAKLTGRERFDKNRPCLERYSIPANAIDYIETVQPYHSRYEPLANLYFLVNQDKHRLPLLAVGRIEPTKIHVTSGGTFVPVQSALTSVAFNTDLIPGKPGKRQVEVYTQENPFVTFDYPSVPSEPIDKTLREILTCVRDINRDVRKYFV